MPRQHNAQRFFSLATDCNGVSRCELLGRVCSPALLQLLSRTKAAVDPETEAQGKKKKTLPKLDDFLNKRDYTGAATLIEVRLGGWGW